jgi:hypothetical protein
MSVDRRSIGLRRRSDTSSGYSTYYNVYGALKCSDCRLEWKSFQPGRSAYWVAGLAGVRKCRECQVSEAPVSAPTV